MTFKHKILIAAAPLALACGVVAASPALADGTPECNSKDDPDGADNDPSTPEDNMAYNTECGANSFVGSGSSNTAVGQDSSATSGDRNTAIGANSRALNGDATAIGVASLAASKGTAMGVRAEAGENATAVGYGSNADIGTAIGMGSTATNGTAIGRDRLAQGGTATGINSGAMGSRSSAYGEDAQAGFATLVPIGEGNTAIGSGAKAGADARYEEFGFPIGTVNATAIGAGAVANVDNAVALGANSVADRANSVSVGTTGGERQITNVGAGTAVTDAVNVGQLNASIAVVNGNSAAAQAVADAAQATANAAVARNAALGQSTATVLGGGSVYNAATGAVSAPSYAIAGSNHSNVGSALAAVDTQLGLLDGRIGTAFDLIEHSRKETRRGIAAAVALAPAPFPSAPGRTSYAANTAVYRGEFAFSASLSHRLDTGAPFAILAGVSHAGGRNTAARVGIAGEF